MRKLLAFAIVALLVQSVAAQYIALPFNRGSVGGPGNFTLVQTAPTSVGCAGSTTCSVALPSSLSASNLATLQCHTTNPVAVVSANVGGTVTPIYSATGNGNVNTLYPAYGYIYPTSSTAGPMVITFSGSIGAGSTCVVREYSLSSGTPFLDWASGRLNSYSSLTSIPGLTPVFSGTNDLEVQMENNDQVITTAVTGSGWGNGKFDATNGPGWAAKANSATTTAPGWTVTSSSGVAAVSGMAFGTDATSCTDIGLMDSSGGTNAATVTTTTLNNSTFGGTGAGTWGAGTGTGPTTLTWATAAQHNLLTSISTCDGHKTGSGTLGVKIAADVSTSFYLQFAWNAVADSFSCGSWFVPHILTSDAQFYEQSACMTANTGSSDFVRVMVSAGQIYIATQADARGNPVFGTKYSFTQDAQYWTTTQYNKYTSAPVSITSVANASGGNTVYTGTITGGGSNAFVGRKFLAYTCAQAANNGVFTVTASTTTTLTLNNPSGVTDTTCRDRKSVV